MVLRAALLPLSRELVLRYEPVETGYPREQGTPPPSLTARLARESDVKELVSLRPEYAADEILSRLRRGEECYLSVVDERIVSMRWTCTGEARLRYLGLSLPLGPDEVCDYELFTTPAYRRRAVRRPAYDLLNRRCSERGLHSRVNCVIPGRKPFGRDNPFSVATIRTVGLGPFRKLLVRTYGPQAEYWRERLKELRWA